MSGILIDLHGEYFIACAVLNNTTFSPELIHPESRSLSKAAIVAAPSVEEEIPCPMKAFFAMLKARLKESSLHPKLQSVPNAVPEEAHDIAKVKADVPLIHF
jgi:hypothetical protein